MPGCNIYLCNKLSQNPKGRDHFVFLPHKSDNSWLGINTDNNNKN